MKAYILLVTYIMETFVHGRLYFVLHCPDLAVWNIYVDVMRWSKYSCFQSYFYHNYAYDDWWCEYLNFQKNSNTSKKNPAGLHVIWGM